MSGDASLREEICRVGASLFTRGYVHASAGNISVRVGDGFLITPTEACLGTLDPARLAHVGADGVQTGGDRASKTLALHRRIYEAAPDAHCVIHTHSTHLVALTLQGVWSNDDIVPPITPYFVMKVGHVPLIPYRRPGDPAAAELVAERIARFAANGTPISRRHARPPRPQRLARHPGRGDGGDGRAGRDGAAVVDVHSAAGAADRGPDRRAAPCLRRPVVTLLCHLLALGCSRLFS